MKAIVTSICLFFVVILQGQEVIFEQPLSVDESGNAPDPSAIVEMQSTTKGILIPRMNTNQRVNIINPVQGLLVFDIDVSAFYFYTGSTWTNLSAAAIASELSDTDTDTKIEVEQTFDEDTIRLTVANYEIAKLDNKTLHLNSESESVYIGEKAGEMDQAYFLYKNVGIGYHALLSSEFGVNNVALGHQALRTNKFGDHNIAIGKDAQLNSTTANRNISIGNSTLRNNTSVGHANIAIGNAALQQDDIHSNGIAIGDSSMYANLAGNTNMAIGNQTLRHNEYGSFLLAIGHESLQKNQPAMGTGDGSANTAIGHFTLHDNVTGYQNTAVGFNASGDLISGRENVAIGHSALAFDTSGSYNVAIGSNAMLVNKNGSDNTAIGKSSLNNNQTGSSNVAVGRNSALRNTTGSGNVTIGNSTLSQNQTGTNNTVLGHAAGHGSGANSLSGSVFIGYHAGYNETDDDRLYIHNSSNSSPLIYGEFDSGLLRVNGVLDIQGNYQFPELDGTANQVLQTDGSGQASWQTLPTDQVDDADADPSNEIQNLSVLGQDLTISGGNTISIPQKWSDGMASDIYYNAGAVGIGVTNPLAALDISESSDATALRMNHSDNNVNSFSFSLVKNYTGTSLAQGIRSNVVATNSSASTGIYSYLQGAPTGNHRSIAAFVDGNGTAIYGEAYSATGLAAEFIGDVIIEGDTDMDGDLVMSDGNGKISFDEGITEKAFISWTGTNLEIENNETSGSILFDAVDDQEFDVGDDYIFRNTGSESMRLNQSGNLGIGTASPSSQLEVRRSDMSSMSELVDFTTTDTLVGNRDILNLAMGSQSADNAQFIECTRGSTVFQVNGSGSTAIGSSTHAAGFMLSVDGKVICEELQIELKSNWPDYVFEDDYTLTSLDETAAFINKNGHLPGIPSAKDVEEKGLAIGDMQKRMMEKIEELTLHMIQLNNENKELKIRLSELEK